MQRVYVMIATKQCVMRNLCQTDAGLVELLWLQVSKILRWDPSTESAPPLGARQDRHKQASGVTTVMSLRYKFLNTQ